MIEFHISFHNPWSDAEYDLLYSAHQRVTENKTLEVALSRSNALWGVGVSVTHRTHHAGLSVNGSLFGYGFEVGFRDNRHWDREQGNWERLKQRRIKVEDFFNAEEHAAEQAFLAKRYNVSDAELAARVRSAPDMGGSILVELSNFTQPLAEKSKDEILGDRRGDWERQNSKD